MPRVKKVAAAGILRTASSLSADFNLMLEEIERRDAELTEARDNLEHRVADRTRKLDGIEATAAIREREKGGGEIERAKTRF